MDTEVYAFVVFYCYITGMRVWQVKQRFVSTRELKYLLRSIKSKSFTPKAFIYHRGHSHNRARILAMTKG